MQGTRDTAPKKGVTQGVQGQVTKKELETLPGHVRGGVRKAKGHWQQSL